MARHRQDELLRPDRNLYHNNGDGTFYDAVFQSGLGTNTKYLGWGVGLFDFDNDGWADIFMSNGHVFPEVDTGRLHVTFKERKIVYKNLGAGRFVDVTASAEVLVNNLSLLEGNV